MPYFRMTAPSPEKTLHANSGRHAMVSRFEVESAERFFLQHLAAA